MSIVCKVKSEKDATDSEEIEGIILPSRLSEFHTFEKLYVNGAFSDYTVTAERKNFRLHKCILSCFEAMLRNDMKEKHENAVVIKDVKYKIRQ